MAIEVKIISLIESPLTNLGYELVRVKQLDKDTVQVMLDSEAGVTIEDCTKATKLINRILQVAELSDQCSLEVSSPGIERPLIKPNHYLKFIGYEVKLTSQILIDGQKRFVGKLTGFNKETNIIEITCDNKVVQIDLDQVQSANLHYIIKNNKKLK
jgi:ribosome maturation factor RimP